MDITFSAEHALLYQTAADFAREALSRSDIRALETGDIGFDRDVWRKMAALGWTAALLSPEHGGSGSGVVEMALIVEACGRAALPSPLFAAVVEAGWLLDHAGSASHRETWLDRIVSADAIATAAVLERRGEYEATQIDTSLEPAGAGYRVTGTKLFVRHAAAADAIICLARSGHEPEDLRWVLVPSKATGVSIRRMPASGGEPLFEVVLDGVRVESSSLLGEPGRGWSLARQMQSLGACLKAAELVGIGKAALDLTIDYAKQRIQFDRPIGSFQAVHHHCADMYRDWQACRLLVYQAAARIDKGGSCAREVSLAKTKASEAIPAMTRLAHQIHGSIAYYRDYPLELYYHRALAAQVAYGDAFFHRRQLAGMLRDDASRFRGDSGHELPVHSV